MKLPSIVVIGNSFSPRAYVDKRGRLNTVPPAPRLAMHEFLPRADGQLEHHIDSVLRATVPPEGLQAYAEQWPDCAALAKLLKRADR